MMKSAFFDRMAGKPIFIRAKNPRFIKRAVLIFLFSTIFFGYSNFTYAAEEIDSANKKQTIQGQIDALEKEIAAIDTDLQNTTQQATSLKREITLFNGGIKKKELELKRVALAIRQADVDIGQTNAEIAKVIEHVDKNKKILAEDIRLLHEYDQESLVSIVIKSGHLSDFFRIVHSVRTLEANTDSLLKELRVSKKLLETKKEDLENFRSDQQSLQALQEIGRRDLILKRSEKDRLLTATKGKETVFQNILKAKKKNLAELKTQLFYLEQTGVTAEEAVRFAELASARTGIRTAFLLALLEVETGKQYEEGVISAGSNLGSGNWRADMNPNQFVAFTKITEALHLDPDTMPVSSRPCSKAKREAIGPGKPCGYGWGGAMGPAQFIPTTWLLFADRVSQLTGHDPVNPWSIEDSFTASALFLADSGAAAKTKDGELRAARTYISGKPSCPTTATARYACIWYGNRVIALAEEIDRNI